MKEAEEILQRKGVKPTPNRIIVLDALIKTEHPTNISELESIIKTIDKSSIFRALNLFLEYGIVHGLEDGSGSPKYEVCKGKECCSIADMHVHFYCEECHSTFCFPSTHIPKVEVPAEFTPRSVNYMIKGICPECKNK